MEKSEISIAMPKALRLISILIPSVLKFRTIERNLNLMPKTCLVSLYS
jgi:hypothetical protein